MIRKTKFYEELKQVFDDFPKYHMEILLGDLMQNLGERIFSNRQFGMRVYIRIAMTVVLQ